MEAIQGFDLDAQEKPFDLVLIPGKPVVAGKDGQADMPAVPGTGLYVRSANAPEVQAIEQQLTVKALTKSAVRGRAIDLKQEADAEAWAETVEGRNTARATAAVSGWYGFVKSGQPVECTPALVSDLFKKRPAWRDLVLAAMDSEANFTQG
jgi:hypothetical protein